MALEPHQCERGRPRARQRCPGHSSRGEAVRRSSRSRPRHVGDSHRGPSSRRRAAIARARASLAGCAAASDRSRRRPPFEVAPIAGRDGACAHSLTLSCEPPAGGHLAAHGGHRRQGTRRAWEPRPTRPRPPQPLVSAIGTRRSCTSPITGVSRRSIATNDVSRETSVYFVGQLDDLPHDARVAGPALPRAAGRRPFGALLQVADPCAGGERRNVRPVTLPWRRRRRRRTLAPWVRCRSTAPWPRGRLSRTRR